MTERDSSEGSHRHYSSQFQEVFGMSLDEAWSDWVAWEHDFQQANLKAIRRFPTTEHRDLSPRALGSLSRAYLDEETGTLFAGIRTGGISRRFDSIFPARSWRTCFVTCAST